MLQFYDKIRFQKSIASALAFAVLGVPASYAAVSSVEDACTPADGFSASPASFAAEVEACMGAAGSAAMMASEARIAALSERHRAQYGLEPLEQRASLQKAARAHAMDMAARGYASHVSPEGLDHLDRVRRLDRSALFGATGANIVILEAGTDAIGAFNALISDEVNAENLRRGAFSHMGVGAAEAANGQIVVVQIFAKVDGLLDSPLPLVVDAPQDTGAQFVDTEFALEKLYLEAVNADAAATRVAHAIVPARHRAGDAALEMEARLGTATFTLHGPVVTIRN